MAPRFFLSLMSARPNKQVWEIYQDVMLAVCLWFMLQTCHMKYLKVKSCGVILL